MKVPAARLFLRRVCLTLLLLSAACLLVSPLSAANMTLTKAMLDDYHLANGIVDFSQATIGYPPNSATNTLGPGDTVFIEAHTRSFLRLKNLRQGTAANPITITNTGGQFIIQAVSPTDYDSQGLGLWGCQHVILKGTPSPGNYDYGIKIASTKNGATGVKISDNGASPSIGSLDVEVTNLEIANTGFAGIQAKCESTPAAPYVMSDIKIHHNYIHDTAGEGMYIGWTSSGHENMSNVDIHHNILNNAGWDGIQVNWVTTNGKIHHNTLIGYGARSDESGSVGDPNYWQNKGITCGGSEIQIYNNWVEATADLAGNPLFIFVKKNSAVYNNVFVYTGTSGDPTPEGGMFVGDSASNPPAAGTVLNVMNNTIVTPEGAGLDAYNKIASVNLYNNIVAAPGHSQPYIRRDAGTEVVNELTNLYVSTVAGAGFTNAAASDYTLASGSGAVNTGTDVSAYGIVDDFIGTARPQGAGYDIGAYERTSSGGDVTAPTVTITSPTSATTYSTPAATVALSGTASDNVAVTQVTWTNDRGGSGTASGTTSWTVGSISLQSGANVITVTARDAANNTSTDILTITYTPADTTAPVVTITSPTSATTYSTSSSTIALGGTASDNVGVTQVTWTNDRGGSGTASGTTSWSVASISLQSGANVITVTARDAANNTSTDVLTVTLTGGTGTELFNQPFSSSTTVSSYVNATAPGANQFNDISAEANGGTWSITSGRLQLVRTGATGATNGAGLTRFTDLSGGGSVFALVKFKLSMANFNTSTDLAKLTMGSLTGLQDYNSTTLESLTSGELVIKGDGNNVFRFLMNQNTTSTTTFPANGTDVTVQWYLNCSGSTKSYTGPDGSARTLNNNAASLWVGTTLLLENIAKPSSFAATGVTDFRLRLDTSYAITLTMDDLTITQLP